MKYRRFCEILNKNIFYGEKIDLLKRIIENPERYVGLFRPTKPSSKILQNLLQSHEIKFGEAMEEIIEEFLKEFGFIILDKNLRIDRGEVLVLDQYFTNGELVYFVEQKIRDDHDSSKKRGQILNFKTKLEVLCKKHKNLIGIMHFIDPHLEKNKNYYLEELKKMSSIYGVELKLFYGGEFFEYLNHKEAWYKILEYLKKWKKKLPEIPEINFDVDPKKSFKEIKNLELIYWERLVKNTKLWEEGIIKAIFKNGETLNLLANFFEKKRYYKRLSVSIKNLLKKYYQK